ncbi:uncharacterized protein YALI1_B12150g [Yarrowia lipolytica]|uniref:Uncharacterized protein n=1 Tax=Yarrowia lipolytica TaxID=4952 RepID=A0A1D8N724_YARLL|nr:hypothetical protein YALI1_B12150g [Yarrowia lipolytica]
MHNSSACWPDLLSIPPLNIVSYNLGQFYHRKQPVKRPCTSHSPTLSHNCKQPTAISYTAVPKPTFQTPWFPYSSRC